MSSRKRTGTKNTRYESDRLLAPDDAALWDEVTKSINPKSLKFNRNNKLTPVSINSADSDGTSFIQKAYVHQKTPIGGPGHQAYSDNPVFQHGQAPGLDRKTKTRMRRGKLDVDRRIDLHGMTQHNAQRALIDFIESSYHADQKVLLVITGKGLTRQGEVGVLRRAVPQWLNQSPISSWIRGFSYAARQHGGEGALYVLLRRRR